ncbi:LamG-like jellyroll fold domain-containing protein [Streptosporangium sp. NPDC023615]|uniref:LamG-like jellyroll fold domain-containing protein n=1 Tax=Streptosporangium sp. NPDC023615 TaxID=3154794 RepID=UPI00341BA1AF
MQLKKADGAWGWVDTGLVERDGVLKPKLAKANTSFSLGGDGPFASLTRGEKQSVTLSWEAPLPRPEITGDVARYAGAAGPSVDLVVTALPSGFRHEVVLRERPAKPVEFRLPVRTKGLTLSTAKGGGLALKDTKGTTTVSAPAPRMWDTADDQPGREAKVATKVETKDGKTVLVLRPDAAWLADPVTRYPVTMEPTTLGITQEAGIVSPNARTGPGAVAGKNHRRCKGTWPNQTCTHRPGAWHALMAFDTAPITGRQVIKATMRLTLREDADACQTDHRSIFANRVTGARVDDGTSWGDRRSTTTEGRTSISACSLLRAGGSVWSRDLTATTREWAGGTANHGLMLRLTDESAAPWNTTEVPPLWTQPWGRNVPRLAVDWMLPPQIPTVAVESIDSLNGDDAIVRSTAVKVTYRSGVPEGTALDYTVSVDGSTTTSPPVRSPTGEAAHWKLDETTGATAADASGRDRPVTLSGGYNRVPGQTGQAVDLNGATGSTSGPVLDTDQSYTVTSWVRLDDNTRDQVIFSQRGVDQPAFTLAFAASGYSGLDQRWVFDQVTPDIPDTVHERWAVSKNVARIGLWTHLAVQYDRPAHRIRLFVDGEPAGERDHTVDWNARGGFQLGRGQFAGTATPFTGAIDDLHVYQRVLSPADLRAMATPPGTTTDDNVPAEQTPERILSLDDPAGLTFVVKACRTGVVPPSCNRSPAYRITSDAATPPSDTRTGMTDPAQPVLSGVVDRPSGGPVTAKYYLYRQDGTPVGTVPLGTRTVNGGERASLQIPAGTVRPGTTYTWQMTACAVGRGGTTPPTSTPTSTTPPAAGGGLEEVCTDKTAAVSFTTPAPQARPRAEDVRHLTLGKDDLVIRTAKTDPTACDGAPCEVTDAAVMRIGDTGTDRTAAVISFDFDKLPEGAAISKAILKLGTPTCPEGTCPRGAVITATPLLSSVTGESTGSELARDADTTVSPFALPLGDARADIAGNEHQWLLLTSNRDEAVVFGDPDGTAQPSLALTYLLPGPPSKVLDLAAQGGDDSTLATWAPPASHGTVAVPNGYDVQVVDSDGIVTKTFEVVDPYVAISDLAKGATYTIKVRARSAYGVSDWETTTVTAKAVP